MALTKKELQAAGKAHESGMSLRALSKQLGCDRHWLSRQLMVHGFTVARVGTPRLPSEVSQLSSEEWAFTAGIILGEGSITCTSARTPHYRVWVSVSQVDVELLTWLQQRLGGKVYTRAYKRGERRRVSSQWVSTRQRSTEEILVRCFPYLVGVKKKQAAAAIKALRSKSANDQARYAQLIQKLKHLQGPTDDLVDVRL